MSKSNRFRKKIIYRVKSHIKRIFPAAQKIDVKIDRPANDEFQSCISVSAPQKTNLFAQKADKDALKALEKSHQAIIRQIHKIKTKREKKSLRADPFRHSA